MALSVLGIDLASSTWSSNGSSLVTFEQSPGQDWLSVRSQCVPWPEEDISPRAMADVLIRFIRDNGVAGISLDGPQGWRDPDSRHQEGVGRFCEFEARCQGKTGVYPDTYPGNQRPWIEFCIDVFSLLRAAGGQDVPATAHDRAVDPLEANKFWLIECFPTSIWRTSQLEVLPGKGNCDRNNVDLKPFRDNLCSAYGLPQDTCAAATHDDLQALVAALPMAGILGGKAKPVVRGEFVKESGGRWCEGIIWDSTPVANSSPSGPPTQKVNTVIGGVKRAIQNLVNPKNPLIVDDRDDSGAEIIENGVRLFKCLCKKHADAEYAVGVGYAQFVERVFGVKTFSEVVGRNYATSDTPLVLELAHQITEESGGRKRLSRGQTTIQAGMDTFIWPLARPHRRADAAFKCTPYTNSDWLKIFPDGERRLLRDDECRP